MFKKVAVFTDIHLGKHSDSETHNKDCLRYTEWFCSQVVQKQCDTVIFMGDFFENRSRIGTLTLDYAIEILSKIDSLNVPIYWIVGNHDMFYKHNRSIISVRIVNTFENITLVNEITEIDNVLLCPYLVGAEYSIPPDRNVKYVFGHFELPLFLLNEMVEMPDRGGLHADHFYSPDAVFSGHFHKRQLKINSEGVPVWYIGNTFPMDFNDANDRERGCMILEWDKDPVFLDWDDAPNYNRINLSTLVELIDNGEFESKFNQYSVIRCNDDIGAELEEIQELRDIALEHIRDIFVEPMGSDLDISGDQPIQQEEKSLDTMVVENLAQFDTRDEPIDKNLLVDLYLGNNR